MHVIPFSPAGMRAKLASLRNWHYLKSEKVRALLASGGTRKILFSGMPPWADPIKKGFRRLPHQIEFGSITKDSFQQYDLVVPLSLLALAEARRHSPHQNKVLPLPTAASVHLCDDKYEFNQALIKSGFGPYIPKMAQGRTLPPPYILKKRISEWGNDCYIIHNSKDEEAQLDRINDPNYFCQEIISGFEEFATHILFIDGRITKALNIKYVFDSDMPIKGQDGKLFSVVHRCPYLELFTRILQTIQFEGLCCINYKVAKGQPFLLEINPRFGGSLAPYFFSFIRHLPWQGRGEQTGIPGARQGRYPGDPESTRSDS